VEIVVMIAALTTVMTDAMSGPILKAEEAIVLKEVVVVVAYVAIPHGWT
jgi:hypothetical protein